MSTKILNSFDQAGPSHSVSSYSEASSSIKTVTTPKNVTSPTYSRPHLYIGRESVFSADLQATLSEAMGVRFDFILSALVHPRFRRDDMGIATRRSGPFTRSDRIFPSSSWSSFVVGKVSTWLNFDPLVNKHTNGTHGITTSRQTCDTDQDIMSRNVQHNSEAALLQEIMWATHLSVPGVLLPPPASPNCFNYARAINMCLIKSPGLQLWLEIPTVFPTIDVDISDCQMTATDETVDNTNCTSGSSNAGNCITSNAHNDANKSITSIEVDINPDAPDPWQAWNNIRVLCGHNPSLVVVLVLTRDTKDDEKLERWLSEPIRAVVLPTSLFVMNRKGFPSFIKRHQRIVLKLMRMGTQFIIRGPAHHESGIKPYWQYVQYLGTKQSPVTELEQFESPFYDYLQVPLQPLKDNLESATYEVFERDPVKYVQYENAICGAIKQRHADKVTLEGSAADLIFVMVVGAGRGPLVKACLRASAKAGVPIKVWAVEKNPNAVVTLQAMHANLGWGDQVTIVAKDMRKWQAPCKADVLVSELLGSFGDNELSPECLDGAQSFLAEKGISVPQNYTSFLAPVQSSKLWTEVASFREAAKFQTPFVVRMHQFRQLASSQRCFYFHHPNRPENAVINNRRMIKLSFTVDIASTVHGFAGYFESELYGHAPDSDFASEMKDRGFISINPQTFSTGMFSWFPMFFPLKEPVFVAAGGTLEFQMWRCQDQCKVWYEWALLRPVVTQIHNPMGCAYSIGL